MRRVVAALTERRVQAAEGALCKLILATLREAAASADAFASARACGRTRAQAHKWEEERRWGEAQAQV